MVVVVCGGSDVDQSIGNAVGHGQFGILSAVLQGLPAEIQYHLLVVTFHESVCSALAIRNYENSNGKRNARK